MRFNCGRPLVDRLVDRAEAAMDRVFLWLDALEAARYDRYERLAEPHRWFAWRPVRVALGECRWLELLERTRTADWSMYGSWKRATGKKWANAEHGTTYRRPSVTRDHCPRATRFVTVYQPHGRTWP